jgi:hypothetical protein
MLLVYGDGLSWRQVLVTQGLACTSLDEFRGAGILNIWVCG